MRSYTAGIAGWVPETVVTTEELEKKLPFYLKMFSKIDIGELTGIRERRACVEGQDIMFASIAAVEKLRASTPFEMEEIDLVIFAGIVREYLEPSTAVILANRLGIKHAIAFDVSNACLGFVDAMMIADSMLASRRCRNALIVSAECVRPVVNNAIKAIRRGKSFYKNFASLTLGDGAAAALLRAADGKPQQNRLLAGVRVSFPEFSEACMAKTNRLDKLQMQTDPRELFKAALSKLPSVYTGLAEVMKWGPDEVDVLVAHQASGKILHKGAAMFDMRPECIVNTLEKFGNMATVSIPFTIAKAIELGKISPGKNVVIAGFGSGLGIGIMAMKG